MPGRTRDDSVNDTHCDTAPSCVAPVVTSYPRRVISLHTSAKSNAGPHHTGNNQYLASDIARACKRAINQIDTNNEPRTQHINETA